VIAIGKAKEAGVETTLRLGAALKQPPVAPERRWSDDNTEKNLARRPPRFPPVCLQQPEHLAQVSDAAFGIAGVGGAIYEERPQTRGLGALDIERFAVADVESFSS